jgi:hypothetical protein
LASSGSATLPPAVSTPGAWRSSACRLERRVVEQSYVEPPAPRRQPAGPRPAALLERPLPPRAARRGDRGAARPRSVDRGEPADARWGDRDVPEDATGLRVPRHAFEYMGAAGWTDAAEDAARMATVRACAGRMEPFASGAYVNALSDDGASGVRRAYPPAVLARLTALKDASTRTTSSTSTRTSGRADGWRPCEGRHRRGPEPLTGAEAVRRRAGPPTGRGAAGRGRRRARSRPG